MRAPSIGDHSDQLDHRFRKYLIMIVVDRSSIGGFVHGAQIARTGRSGLYLCCCFSGIFSLYQFAVMVRILPVRSGISCWFVGSIVLICASDLAATMVQNRLVDRPFCVCILICDRMWIAVVAVDSVQIDRGTRPDLRRTSRIGSLVRSPVGDRRWCMFDG